MSTPTSTPTSTTTFTLPAGLTAGTWTVDPSHSSVGFVARHLMVSKVRGAFTSFNGAVTIVDGGSGSGVQATVDTASLTTGDDGRDGHVRSADFFDVDNFPTMTLVSTDLKPTGDGQFELIADLTIKGVTKSVTFDLEFVGVATDPWGNVKAGFAAEAEISRKAWGLEWNVALEAGGVLVGDKVKLQLDIQAVRG